MNLDGQIVDVAVPTGFDITALKAGISSVTGDAVKTFRLRCGMDNLTGKVDLASVVGARVIAMVKQSTLTPMRQAQLAIARGERRWSKHVFRALHRKGDFVRQFDSNPFQHGYTARDP